MTRTLVHRRAPMTRALRRARCRGGWRRPPLLLPCGSNRRKIFSPGTPLTRSLPPRHTRAPINAQRTDFHLNQLPPPQNKWECEYATAEQGTVEINVTSFVQSVYIARCDDATIVVNGKCNSILVDNCRKTKVLVDSCVSTLEICNCQRMQVQVKENAPSIAIDKTDGILVYLSEEILANPDFSITASKSSEMNTSFPFGPDGDYVEKPLPEQFVYKLDTSGADPTITSEVSDLYSS